MTSAFGLSDYMSPLAPREDSAQFRAIRELERNKTEERSLFSSAIDDHEKNEINFLTALKFENSTPLSSAPMEIEEEMSQDLSSPFAVNDFINFVCGLTGDGRKAFIKKQMEGFLADNKYFLNIPIDDRLFSHILCAHIIKGTHLEAISYSDSIAFFLSMLSKIKLPSASDFLLSEITKKFTILGYLDKQIKNSQTPETISEVVDFIIGTLSKLPLRGSLLIPGGWITHAMLFEVVKMSEEKFLLRVFNTGECSKHHVTGIAHKEFIKSFIEISDISSEKMTSKAFWERFIDICQNRYTEKEKSNGKDLYKKLLFFLGGKLFEQFKGQLTTPQYSGVCAVKVIKAYLKFNFGNEAFRSIIFQIEFWALANYFFKTLKKPLTQTQRVSLSWAKKKLNRDALDLCSLYKKAINAPQKEYIEKNLGFTSDLLQLLALDETVEARLTAETEPQKFPEVKLEQWLKNQRLTFDDRKHYLDPSKNIKLEEINQKNFKISQPCMPAAILSPNCFSEWHEYLLGNREDRSFCLFAINHLLENLPVPAARKGIFGKKEDGSITIKTLSSICFIYMRAANGIMAENASSSCNKLKVFLNFCHLFALLAETAGSSASGEGLNKFGFYLPFLDVLFKTDGQKIQWDSAKTIERYEALKEYYEDRNLKKLKLFAYETSENEMSFQVDLSSFKTFGDFAFLRQYLDKKLINKLQLPEAATDLYTLTSLFANEECLPREYSALRKVALIFQLKEDRNFPFLRNEEFDRFFGFEAGAQDKFIILNLKRSSLDKRKKSKLAIAVKAEVEPYLTYPPLKGECQSFLEKLLTPEAPLVQKLTQKIYTQNQGLCGEAKELLDANVDKETTQRLREVFLSDSLRLHYCLILYSENLALLETIPEVLRFIFADARALKKELSRPFFATRFEIFLKKSIALYQNDLSKAATTLELIEFVHSCSKLVPNALDWEKAFQTRSLLNKTIELLEEKLRVLSLEGNEKIKEVEALVQRGQMLFLSSFEETSFLDSSNVRHILKYWFKCALGGSNAKKKEVIIKLEKPLNEFLKKDLRPFKQGLADAMPFNIDENQEWVGDFPWFSHQKLSINILEGILRVDNKMCGPLPGEFLETYETFFGTEGISAPFYSLGTKAWSLDGKIELHIKGPLKGACAKVEKNLCRLLIPKSGELPIVPVSRELTFFYIPTEDPKDLFWMGKGSLAPHYEMVKQKEQSGKFVQYTIKDLKTGYFLLNSNLKSLKKLPWQIREFLKIEGIENLRIWMDENNQSLLRSIELPHYNLSFHFENGSFIVRDSEELEGYKLVLSRKPLFPHFSHYITLEKSNGNKLLLLPNTSFGIKAAAKTDALNPLVKIWLKRIDLKNPYILYELEENKIIPKSLLDQILLVYIRIISREFEEALSALKKCWKDTPYTLREFELFCEMERVCESHKFVRHPELFSFYNYKNWLILQNHSLNQFASSAEKLTSFRQRITQQYCLYLQHLKAIEFKMPLPEEIKLLEIIKGWGVMEESHQLLIEHRELALSGDTIRARASQGNTSSWLCGLEGVLFKEIPKHAIKRFKELKKVANAPLGPIRPRISPFQNFWHVANAIFSKDPYVRDCALCDLLFIKKEEILASSDGIYAIQLLLYMQLFTEALRPQLSPSIGSKDIAILVAEFNKNILGFKKQFSTYFEWKKDEREWLKTFKPLDLPLPATPLFEKRPTFFLPSAKSMPATAASLDESVIPISALFAEYFSLQKEPVLPESFPLLKLAQTPFMEHSPLIKHSFADLKTHYEALSPLQVEMKMAKEEIVDKLLSYLKARIKYLDYWVKESQQLIEKQANLTPISWNKTINSNLLLSAISKNLKIEAKLKKPITYNECRYAQIRKDPTFLAIRNPYLSEKSIAEILRTQAITSWYFLELRQAKECLVLVKKWQVAAGVQEKQLLSLLANQMLVHNEPSLVSSHPFLLAYQEMTHNFRDKQKAIVIQALENKSSHFFFQLMMGEGKTHVLMPAFAYLLADGVKIPCMIIPATHYAQTKRDLKATTELQNGQHVYEFLFVRQLDCTKKALKHLNEILKQVQLDRGCLITTPESIQGIRLAFLDYTRLRVKSGKNKSIEIRAIYEQLRAIVTTLSSHGIGIGEEAQIILQSLKELNFTLGKATAAIPEKRWALTLKIYKILSKEFGQFLQTSEGRAVEKNGPEWGHIKKVLIEKLVDCFFPVSENRWENEWRKSTVSYLSASAKNTEFLDEIAKYNAALAHDIIRAKEQLNNFLPHSLSKDVQVDYGKRLPLVVATPYVGNNTPSLNSEFGHPYMILNFSIQMYLKLGLSFEQFHSWLGNLKQIWVKEFSSLEDPEIASFQREIFGNDFEIEKLDLKDTKGLIKIYDDFRKHPKIIFHYLETKVMPAIQEEKSVMSSNSLDLSDAGFNKFIAFGATPYNLLTFSQKLIDNAALDKSTIADLLWILNKPENQKVDLISDAQLDTLITYIKEYSIKNPNFKILNDLGALFLGIDNLEVAKALLFILPENLKGVVFYGQSKELMILMRDEKIYPFNSNAISEKERFTYLDQVHSFGTNVSQDLSAIQLITCNKETLFFEILQASMRSRLLKYGQRISYLIPEADASCVMASFAFDETLTANHLLMNGFINENNQLEREIVVSTMQKILHLFKDKVFQEAVLGIEFSNQMHIQEVKSLLQQFFITRYEDNPMQQYKEFEQEVTPFQMFSEFYKSLLSKGPIMHGEEKQKEVLEIINNACSKLPSTISTNLKSSFSKEIQKQEERAILCETLVSHDDVKGAYQEEDWDWRAVYDQRSYSINCNSAYFGEEECPSLPFFLQLNQWLKSVNIDAPFSDQILMTQNFIKSINSKEISLHVPLKSVSYFLEVATEGSLYVVLLSLREANKLRTFLDNRLHHPITKVGVKYVALRNLNGDCLSIWGDQLEQSNAANQIQASRVQLSIFNGAVIIPHELEKPTEEWLVDKDRSLWMRNFEVFHAKHFENSDITSGNLYRIMAKRKRLTQVHRNAPLLKRRHIEMLSQSPAISFQQATIGRDKGKERIYS